MRDKSIRQLGAALEEKQISAVELANYFLSEIKIRDRFNAVVYTDEEQTLAAAKLSDKRRAKGERVHILEGIPITYKDAFCQQGWPTTCASKSLKNFVAPYTATVVARLQAAGMVPLGRTNMDEFAMGSTTETSCFGPTLNPWDQTRIPGGSSGGSAAAVAARLCPVSLGSDTGGSIRQPAAYCGITGIKPTYGLVSRFGLVAYASSFDQPGPMAKSAEDLAWILGVMAGFDCQDSTSINHPVENYEKSLKLPLKGLKIGVPREFLHESLDDEVQHTYDQMLLLLRQLGAISVDVSLPNLEQGVAVYYVLTAAEASSNLQRYDGVRYGLRSEQFEDLVDFYSRTRAAGFGKEVKRRIMMGTYVLSHGYYDAYYVKAQKVRSLIAQGFQQAFEECDVLLSPVTPSVAPKLKAYEADPIQMYLSDIYTVLVNLAGLPALSLPGIYSKQGLPVGMQLIGKHFKESQLLNIAYQIQQNSDWHLASPV